MSDTRQQNRPPLALPRLREHTGVKGNTHLAGRLGAVRALAVQNRDREDGR